MSTPSPMPTLVAVALTGRKEKDKVMQAMAAALSSLLPDKRNERQTLRRVLGNAYYGAMATAARRAATLDKDPHLSLYKAIRNLSWGFGDDTESLSSLEAPSIAAYPELQTELREAITWFVGLDDLFVQADLDEIERDATHVDPIAFEASREAADAARTIFRDATATAFDYLHGQYRSRYNVAMAAYHDASQRVEHRDEEIRPLRPVYLTTVEGYEKRHDLLPLITRIVGWDGAILSADEVERRIDRAARLDAERARLVYVERNGAKLAPALDGLGLDPTVSVETPDTTFLLERMIQFQFSGGTRFTMTTSVEDVTNASGTQFLRFPCRFSDVFDADGQKMSSPSAGKIASEFGLKKRGRKRA